MSHQITSTDGLWLHNKPAWHNLGNVTTGARPDAWEDVRILADLTWDPEIVDGYHMVGDEFVKADTHKYIRRNDNHEILGKPTDKFHLITNEDLGPIADALMNDKRINFETAGSVRGGKSVWALIYLNEPFAIPGDPNGEMLSYMSLINHNTGRGSLRAAYVNTRIVCANTIAAAERESDAKGTGYVFRHLSSWQEQVEEAKAAIEGMERQKVEYAEWAKHLLTVTVKPKQFENFLVDFMPMPPESMISDRVIDNVTKARESIRSILDSKTCEGINGTAYGVVQAAVEYADHKRLSMTQDGLIRRAILEPQKIKIEAQRILLDIVG